MKRITVWYTVTDGRIDRIRQVHGDTSPGRKWRQAPDGWLDRSPVPSPGDCLLWFGEDGYRLPDEELVEKGLRVDNTGLWFHKEEIGKSTRVHRLDDPGPGGEWAREATLEGEPYQK